MNGHTAETKLISLFVLAFVCLNGMGAVCVAYCRGGAEMPAAAAGSTHHCERASKSDAEERSPSIARTREGKPCPMTVSFFGGPLEKHQAPLAKAAPAAAVAASERPGGQTCLQYFNTASGYRGPPPLDRRIDRIKNRVLRI